MGEVTLLSVSVRQVSESFELVGEGLEFGDVCVIPSSAPIREVQDVDDGKPTPLQPRPVALPE